MGLWTSALGPELVGEVLAVVRILTTCGMAMLVATHEIGFAREVGHQSVFTREGQIVESGDPREVLTNPQRDRNRACLASIL